MSKAKSGKMVAVRRSLVETLEQRQLLSGAVADFAGASGTADSYAGIAGNGWSAGWTTTTLGTGTFTQGNGTATTNAAPLHYNGVYLSAEFKALQASGIGSVSREYTSGVNTSAAHDIQFLYRFDGTNPSNSNFNSGSDTVDIFGDVSARYWMGATNTWATFASGDTMTWKFQNGASSTDTGVSLVKGDVYQFTIQVFPGGHSYRGAITDLDDSTNTYPLQSTNFGFRDSTASTSSFINFNMRLSNNGEIDDFSFDKIAVGVLPTAPSSFTATPASTSQINLSWSDSDTNVASYKLERSTSSTFTSPSTIYSGSSTSYNNTGLSEGVKYYYRVTAIGISGTPTYGGPSTSTTTNAATTLRAPTSPVATIQTSTQLHLTWSLPTIASLTGFTIQRATNSGFTGATTLTASSTARSYDDSVSASTTYYYRIRSESAATSSTWTNFSAVTTPAAGFAAPPTSLSATKISSTEIDLSWTNNSGTGTTFTPQRSSDDLNWTNLTTGLSGTTYNDTSVSSSASHYGLYFYRIIAVNSSNTGTSLPQVASAGTTATVSASGTTASSLNTFISGQTAGTTIIFSGGIFNLGDNEIYLNPDLNYISQDGSTLSGGSGSGSGNWGDLLKFNSGSGHDNVAISGLTLNGGGIFMDSTTGLHNILIDGNDFKVNTASGAQRPFGISVTSEIDDSQFSNNLFESTLSGGVPAYANTFGVVVDSDSVNLTVTNNDFVNITGGIHINSPYGSTISTNLQVEQNYFSGIKDHPALELQGTVAGVKIYDNTYVNPVLSSTKIQNDYSLGFSVPLNGSSNVDIERNYINAPLRPDAPDGGTGVRFGFELGGISTTVTDNYVYGTNAVAAVDDLSDAGCSVTVTGNHFDDVLQAPLITDLYVGHISQTNVTGGTYTLTVVINSVSQTTAAIAYNASNATIQAALEALTNVGSGNVSVDLDDTGTPTATFSGSLNVPAMTADGTNLTGGTIRVAGTIENRNFVASANDATQTLSWNTNRAHPGRYVQV